MTEKLPPGTLCVVCEDLATGNHYSVPSCNGCKTFFRRAVVNHRTFACMGSGNCQVNKGVRCACRHCRFRKCLSVGMDRNSIQNDRDRIGYTKRNRKTNKGTVQKSPSSSDIDDQSQIRYATFVVMKIASPRIKQRRRMPAASSSEHDVSDGNFASLCPASCSNSASSPAVSPQPFNDPMLERLCTLENNFTMLLSRGDIDPYPTLDEALAAPSRFAKPVDVKITDPIAQPKPGQDQHKMPFWRSRIIALYIDWAKTFSVFRNLPYSDKISLLVNHASSYMIMCEAFRTPENVSDKIMHPDGHCFIRNPPPTSQFSHNFLSATNSLPYSNICTPIVQRSNVIIRPLPPSAFAKLDRRPLYDLKEREFHAFLHLDVLKDTIKSSSVTLASNVAPSPAYSSNGSLSGLTPVMAAMIDYVMKPFRNMNISTTEFATLQAIMFFDPDTDDLDSASQRNVAAEQKRLLTALYRYIMSHNDSAAGTERYSEILLRIPTIRKVAAKKNESLQIIDMFNLFTLNSLVKETALGIRQPNAQVSSSISTSAFDEVKQRTARSDLSGSVLRSGAISGINYPE